MPPRKDDITLAQADQIADAIMPRMELCVHNAVKSAMGEHEQKDVERFQAINEDLAELKETRASAFASTSTAMWFVGGICSMLVLIVAAMWAVFGEAVKRKLGL